MKYTVACVSIGRCGLLLLAFKSVTVATQSPKNRRKSQWENEWENGKNDPKLDVCWPSDDEVVAWPTDVVHTLNRRRRSHVSKNPEGTEDILYGLVTKRARTPGAKGAATPGSPCVCIASTLTD